MEKIKNKTKSLSFRLEESLNDFIEGFVEKTKLSKTEVITFFLKRGIGVLKSEKEEVSVLDIVLNVLKDNKDVTSLDLKIIKTIYRLLDLDIIFDIKFRDKISKDLSLNLINHLIGEKVLPEEMLEHIQKMDKIIPNFSPYLLLDARQEIKRNYLTKKQTEDIIFTISVTTNVIKFKNNNK